MNEEYFKWYSPSLSLDIEMLTFGHSGQPLILFPTSQGRYFENKDFKLIEAVQPFLEEGKIKIYCPDSMDAYSWYNKEVHPAVRVKNHLWYERMLQHEIIPTAIEESDYTQVILAGCSFGGYHAANFAFKHPELVSHLFCMSGAYDMSGQLDGFYNDDVYYNSPLDFMPHNNNPDLWKMKIALGVAEHDICRTDNERLSVILSRKGIDHWLDVRPDTKHDWDVWRSMFSDYVNQL